jgi:hypothetical protein
VPKADRGYSESTVIGGSRDVHSSDVGIDDEAQRTALALQANGVLEKEGRDEVANSSACSSGSMSENQAEIEW